MTICKIEFFGLNNGELEFDEIHIALACAKLISKSIKCDEVLMWCFYEDRDAELFYEWKNNDKRN